MKRVVILLLICLSNGWLFANHWTPNDSDYEDNLTLTGVIQIDGVEQQSTILEVGAFCGEECRGSGYPTYFFPTQRYVIQLLIFGEIGDQLTFKLYDSDSGQELNLTSPEAVSFVANGYGSLTDPYVLNFTESGENYTISVNVNPSEGGNVQGAGTYLEGQTCTLVATANEGYAFSNWTENGTVVSTNPTYVFSVTSDHTLVANFIITGNSTHWVPNESEYEDNMTLTGVIQINGVEQQSTTLEVGVFCGEECRSTGLPTYFFPTQRYVIQLLIFGENGDQLTFKLYDHSTGQELNLTSPDAVAFIANGYGSLGNPYVLNFTGNMPSVFRFTTAGNWGNASNWSGGALPGTNDAVSIDANCALNRNAEVASLVITSGNTLTLRSGKVLTVTGALANTTTTGLVIKDGAQLINASSNVAATMEKSISAHDGASTGWYTIASPMNEMAIAESGFVTPEYDLYRFNETNLTSEEWENHKANFADFTTFEKGRGYLYANNNDFTPTFTGTLNASAVTYSLTCTNRPNDPLSGFNLIGNPFPHEIYKGVGGAIDNVNLASGYYTLDNEGTWQVHTFADAIQPGQGILVKATAPTILTIAKSTDEASAESGMAKQAMIITVSGATGTDRAIVYFGQGIGLNKVEHRSATAPSISIQNEGGEYAIAHFSNDCKSLELLFNNSQPSEFTLNVSIDKAQFSYLHLIDNETGSDVDLLQQQSYSFTATGQEKANRFTLVFVK